MHLWRDLPFTEQEARDVRTALALNGWQTAGFFGGEASESTLRQHSAPTLLHIATHGFFLEDSSEVQEVFSAAAEPITRRSPLLRSGLVLAGANVTMRALRDQSLNAADALREDGILFAEEISHLRLDETELVVLSACETASGSILNGEGVFGLQRAFLLAGARNVMMSLWQINDQATALLMRYFYEDFARSHDAHAALRQAQLRMVHEGYLPCDWGTFVILSR
jgi:CHAT domain-containing protein